MGTIIEGLLLGIGNLMGRWGGGKVGIDEKILTLVGPTSKNKFQIYYSLFRTGVAVRFAPCRYWRSALEKRTNQTLVKRGLARSAFTAPQTGSSKKGSGTVLL